MLALEKLNADASGSRAISISFSRVERELESRRTLILKYPSRYIPSNIEELTDIPLKLSSKGVKIVEPIIDAISIKSFTLRVKIKDIEKLAGVDLSSVDEAHIEAKSPDFLLDALINAFNALKFEPTFDMKSNLPTNIQFIFGPPGTGKTTYLAREVLIPMMRQRGSARILVLTPTNKAADVLVARIISMLDAEGDQSYRDWLIRFVLTGDELIEQSGVLRERTFDVMRLERSITVTTVARFPYDYFIAGDNRRHLRHIDWDYIVIDEASMIPLAYITLPLHKKTPRQFIIAGDPFQIEPITNVAQWKDENIYSMIKLASFQNPTTTTHNYSVRLLTTQYRSIPTVGRIFGLFAYDGVLKHHRRADSQRRLSTAHNQKISIGIIAPYRAEADLINKLSASMKLPPLVDVQVGTIHGFQGDECDIIFVVLNPPPFISDSDDMFLNKINIINVAISRARDYLFVLLPDARTENIERLRLVSRLERLIKSVGECCEMQSNEIEKIIFGSPTFIEENAFSTAHQDVNIYGSVERRYEIRSEDTAVDIQLHY